MKDIVSIIVPAHNEEKIIGSTIRSILSQTYKEIKIYISCDNCTDNTVNIAQEFNVTVYKTHENKGKRSGAINQVLYNTDALESNYIMVFDADSTLDKKAVENAVNFLAKNKKYISVCSRAELLNTKSNFLIELQRIEYGRFNTERIETQGNIMISHGLCSIFKCEILKKLYDIRGYIYDEKNLIEDFELTQALKHLYPKNKLGICKNIIAYTDVPETLTEFWNQRLRWSYGSLSVLNKYPFNKHTYKENMSHYFFFFMFLFTGYLTIGFIKEGCNFTYLWGILFGLTITNSLIRTKYIKTKYKKTYILILTIIPEIIYNLFHAVIFIWSYYLYYIKGKLILKNDSYAE